jgi:DNA-binding MarR family transcriptional regulator
MDSVHHLFSFIPPTMRIEDEIIQPKFKNAMEKAVINLMFTYGWITDRQTQFFKPFDLTGQQYNILRILKGQHPKSISGTAIKARMLDKNSDVSRLLDRLALKQLIEKKTCPSDKRAADVTITPKGLDVLADIEKRSKEFNAILSLTNEEATQLSDLLDKCRG